eukprot:TRINITY_DN277_c0_g1_i1.p1 TRINITY_DN277_c0_g1~~TRINITY_DN277_c0_g1_i1.p1  ORF type:complete len:856 (+),score=372.25 TRINITY_DN277_c0_g1_i1:231-2798(+)
MFGGSKTKDKKEKSEKSDKESTPKREEKKDKPEKPEKKKGKDADDHVMSSPGSQTKPAEPLKTSNTSDQTEKERAIKEEEERRKKLEEEKRKADEKKKEEERKKEEEKKKAEKEKEKPQPETPKKEDKKKTDTPKKEENGKKAAVGGRTAASQENVEAEIQSLESAKLDPSSETANTYKDVYNLFPADVFASYDKLQNFARDLNTQFATPEIVVIGKKSHAKSSLIEAFFGEPLNAIGEGGLTKRPVFINVINNVNCTAPKLTVKRDQLLKEFDHDKEVSLKDVGAELEKRNKQFSEEPIILQYESKGVCNFTLIDTPGLLEEDDTDPSREERDSLVLKLAKPTHRTILCVEQAKDWSRIEMVNFVKRVDPELSRTAFVYTKFQSQLQTFTSTREVNKFLSQTLPDVKTFFVTLPTEGVRAQSSDPEKFKQRIYQAYRRDMNALEQLQFDKRYESYIGLHALRKWVLNNTWKNYQESIPRILKQLRAKKVETEKKIKDLESQLGSLDTSKLRSIGSNYVVNFLQVIERLIAGTSEGNPTVNGQTLEEEKHAHGIGDWVDLYNQPTRFEPEEWKIPYWDNKIYGGQQFERLLSEFKAVSEHTDIPEVTMDDVATAAGINKLNNIPNYAWAAADLAQQKSQDAFVPLIDQLTNRAVYIMKRLTDIAQKILEGRRKKWIEDMNVHSHQSGESIDDLDRYPYFTYHVKDLYNKFVDTTAKLCKEKCLDEFYSTRTIYWEQTEYADRNMPLERTDMEDTKTAVVHLATDLFLKLRLRITTNVLLKFYNFFLVPMQSDLWNEIQGKVNCLGDSSLEQIFEVTSTKDKLKESIKGLNDDLSKFAEKDKQFMQYAASFSRRVD